MIYTSDKTVLQADLMSVDEVEKIVERDRPEGQEIVIPQLSATLWLKMLKVYYKVKNEELTNAKRS